MQEFGKVKIYMPPQDSNDEVPKEVHFLFSGSPAICFVSMIDP